MRHFYPLLPNLLLPVDNFHRRQILHSRPEIYSKFHAFLIFRYTPYLKNLLGIIKRLNCLSRKAQSQGFRMVISRTVSCIRVLFLLMVLDWFGSLVVTSSHLVYSSIIRNVTYMSISKLYCSECPDNQNRSAVKGP